MKDYEKARIAYETAAKSADLYLAPLQRLAEMYEELGDQQSQLRYLQKLDSISPLNVNRKVSLGEIHLAMGEPEKAEELFDKAMAQITKEAMDGISALSGRIASIYADRDPAKAEKFLRNSLEVKGKYLSKGDIMLFNQLGISLRKQGRWKDAITEYKRAIKIAPEDENLYYNVGMAFAEGGDFLQAKANLLKAVDLNPEIPGASPNIAYNFGAVFLQSKDRERAAQFFKLALQLRPWTGGRPLRNYRRCWGVIEDAPCLQNTATTPWATRAWPNPSSSMKRIRSFTSAILGRMMYSMSIISAKEC